MSDNILEKQSDRMVRKLSPSHVVHYVALRWLKNVGKCTWLLVTFITNVNGPHWLELKLLDKKWINHFGQWFPNQGTGVPKGLKATSIFFFIWPSQKKIYFLRK